MSISAPAGHPPVDWNNWSPPKEGDVRCPCPMLNALANHNVLPHNGRGITREAAMDALMSALNLSHFLANMFVSKAVKMNPDNKGTSFDLDHLSQHGVIEHDCSLSRDDFIMGNNHTYDHPIWDVVMQTYEDKYITNFALASKARYNRLMAAKKAHEAVGKPFNYGFKEAMLSYGETSLFLGVLGDSKNGKIPISYMKALFEEERLPAKEGWTRIEEPLTQWNMNHLMLNLLWANPYALDEMRQVGISSIMSLPATISKTISDNFLQPVMRRWNEF